MFIVHNILCSAAKKLFLLVATSEFRSLESLIIAFSRLLDFKEKNERGERAKKKLKGKGRSKRKRKRREKKEEKKIKTWASESKGNDARCVIKNVAAKLKSRVKNFFPRGNCNLL